MGRFVTTAIITLALAGAAVESHAEDVTPAPTPAPAAASTPLAPSPEAGAPPPGRRMGMMPRPPGPDAIGWAAQPDMRPGMQGAMWRMHQMEKTWGLFFNQRDKNLSDGDVQVLAEAILLVHGNHDWKVINVADATDGQATFAYATKDGSVVARFEVDRHSGRMMRIG
jgi:hypothetical protein